MRKIILLALVLAVSLMVSAVYAEDYEVKKTIFFLIWIQIKEFGSILTVLVISPEFQRGFLMMSEWWSLRE